MNIKFYPMRDFRYHVSTILDDVTIRGQIAVIGRHRRPQAALVSLDMLKELLATRDIVVEGIND